MAEPTTTRRAVMGAIAAIPAAMLAMPSHAAVARRAVRAAIPDAGRFNRRLATFRRREREQEAFYARTCAPANGAHDALIERLGGERDNPAARASFLRVQATERAFDCYVDRTNAAMRRVIVTPAPDNRALAVKVEAMLADGLFDCGGCEDLGRALLADARRLAGEA